MMQIMDHTVPSIKGHFKVEPLHYFADAPKRGRLKIPKGTDSGGIGEGWSITEYR